ncbi:ataxin-1 [Misgurnus anguillicaudatus]|uniref:ataxin-1 n=1 Tax=Misgurnus anguillicaudatus TaxID=75329 RepID=UPI003CCF4EB3
MKSNQERSNECLPPKKREILALEEKQVLVSAAVSESQSGENLAWLASVATMASMAHIPNNAGRNSAELDSSPPSNKALTVVTEYSPPTTTSAGFSFSSNSSTYRGVFSGPTVLTANPTVLSTSLPQTIGSVQYTHLSPNLQLIGPYTSYISSQIVPSTTSPTQPRRTPQEVLATTAVISQASSIDSHSQHVISAVPNVSHSQCIQVESAPLGLTVSSPTAQLPLQIHPHSAVQLAPHGLALTPSQVVLHYTDGFIAKHPDSRDMPNGALGEVTVVKNSTSVVRGISSQAEGDQSHKQNHNLGLQTQAQVLLPADYSSHDRTGLQTSLMLVSSGHLANSNAELQSILGKDHSSLHLNERGGICLGKPMSRVCTLVSSDNQVPPASTISPHTLLQAPHNTPQQELPTNLYSATQLPIIGYITGAASGPQQAGYQSNLPQHVVISGSPSLLIPVSATNINPSTAEPEVTRCSFTPRITNASTALHQSFINAAPPAAAASVLPNGKDITGSDAGHAPCVIQSPAQIQLPVLTTSVVESPAPVTPPASTSPHSSSPTSPSAGLPPFFMKGSIIQLADGELKRVEDLRTEDFVQSAEVSGELKIDSSTVERIECSRSPNAVIIQFSVGENKAQVCVEVLVEYPFFVFGQGWSSCCPDRTTQLLALSCAKLSVGDVCISLTLKSLKNSIQKKDYFSDSVVRNNSPHLKAAKSNGPTDDRPNQMDNHKRGFKITSREEGSFVDTLAETSNTRNVLTHSNNGGISPMANHQDQSEKTYTTGAERAVSRKRRWSAPEKGEIIRSKEDTPVLPKFSYLPHQLKVSIEGRSSTGS